MALLQNIGAAFRAVVSSLRSAFAHFMGRETMTGTVIHIPGLTREAAMETADHVNFYRDGYDLVLNRTIAPRGRKEFLGSKPNACRFCGETAPKVKFRKEAHAVPELTGNGTLLSHYECDDCNARFSSFEGDLGKYTLLDRIAGQVFGKDGIPSAKTAQKQSRIDVDMSGFKIEERVGDPIAVVDEEKKTLTVTIAPQPYRPLGVFKALVKTAITVMDQSDLAKVQHALRWLREPDLTTNQIDDGTRYTCIRTFTPGEAPFGPTRVVLLRRKNKDVLGPKFIFPVAFGNLSLQIVVPSPQCDKHLAGKDILIRPVPVFAFLDKDLTYGLTQFSTKDLSSPTPIKGPPSVIFNFDHIEWRK